MKTYFLYLVLVLTISVSKAQPYKNVIVPTEFGNVNAFAIYKNDDRFLLTGIFGNNQSCLFDLDSELNLVRYFIYDSTSFSRAGLQIIDNRVFTLSKNRFQSKGLQFLSFDNALSISAKKDIPTLGEYNFPISTTSVDQNILGSYIYEEGSMRKFGIFCVKPDGDVKWNKTYENNNIRDANIWDLQRSKTDNILAGYAILYKNEFESVARVMKIDTLGNELWKSDSLRGIDNINAIVSIAELSDSSIFVTFKKDMHKDPDFFMKLHPFPPTYIWLDKDGRKVREHILRISRDYEVYISEVKAGRGDYFYVYGQLTSFNDNTSNDYYGFITKYANNGDTIWTHTYRHPDYNNYGYFHYVNDMIEEDNGDLTVLGAIAPIAGKNEVWVFRVNSEGCYGTQMCDDLVLSTHGDADAAYGMTVYPNPTAGMINIEGLPVGAGAVVRIYSSDGRLCYSGRGEQVQKIDIRHLPAGVYIAQVSSRRWSQAYKIIKQ